MDWDKYNQYFKELKDKVEGLQLEERHRELADKLVEAASGRYCPPELKLEIEVLLEKITGGEESELFRPVAQLVGQLLDDEYGQVVDYIITHAVEYPYSTGYYRRPYRTTVLKEHMGQILTKVISLVHLHKINFSVLDYLTMPVYEALEDYYVSSGAINDIIAFEIDKGNDAVLRALHNVIYGDNNTALLSGQMISGIFQSHNEQAYRMIGELLVAARLQEGLRQSIVERMDQGTLAAMIYMLEVINTHDLGRFSSVVRALDVWTGLGLEAANGRVAKQCLTCAAHALTDEALREKWLTSSNTIEIYMSLWAEAVHDEHALPAKIKQVMDGTEDYRKIVAQYVVSQSQNEALSFKIAAQSLEEHNQELQYLIIMNYKPNYSYRWVESNGKHIHELELTRRPELEDEQLRKAHFEAFDRMLQQMGKKDLTKQSQVFDWMYITLSTDMIAKKMLYLAAYDMNRDWIVHMIEHRDLFTPDVRGDLLKLFMPSPHHPRQREFIIGSLADKSMANREFALVQAGLLDLQDHEFTAIANLLKLKTGTLRQSAIQLLLRQPADDLHRVIGELLQSRNELQRLAALEMLNEMKENEALADQYKRWEAEVLSISNATEKEQLLIAKLQQQVQYSKANGFGLYDPGSVVNVFKRVQEPLASLAKVKAHFTMGTEQILSFLSGLSERIHTHRNYEYEYETYLQEKVKVLLGDQLVALKRHYDPKDGLSALERYPLAEVWQSYILESGLAVSELLQIAFYLEAEHHYQYYTHALSEWQYSYIERAEGWRRQFMEQLFPMEVLCDIQSAFQKLPYNDAVKILVSAALDDSDKKVKFQLASDVLQQIIHSFPEDAMEKETRLLDNFVDEWDDWTRQNVYDDESFAVYFRLFYQLYAIHQYERSYHSLHEYARAYELKLVDADFIYQELLGRPGSSNFIRQITNLNREELKEQPLLVDFKTAAVQRILEIELNRGDLATAVTAHAMAIQRIDGAAYFVRILAGLDKESFVRGYIYSYNGDATKKEIFSHLLKVCYPLEGEDEALLGQLLQERSITDERLLEAAMYAPQWVEIISRYLGWNGLRSAAWYFHAHINESFSAEKETIVAHFSPIESKDFNDGAFDLKWFKEAYEELGELKFDVLYQCAKYISAGANHRRSQLFADAVLGRLTLVEMKQSTADKRNKDHLLSYGLIPLAEEPQRWSDLLERYEFIQQFLKESKTFGAQRRASEAKTASIALDNLARNAGYADVVRMTWDLESSKIDEVRAVFEPVDLDGLTARLTVTASGLTELQIERGGKSLKSVPASHKKHPYIIELKETQSALKDQYRRAKSALEKAMESSSVFKRQEIDRLLQNPVIAPLLSVLVFGRDNDLGFYTDGMLTAPGGERYPVEQPEEELVIAHPLHLYQSGRWSEYQQELFEKQIMQPFKQVFRELYMPNEDELSSSTASRRYAGHQVQPRKAAALLKNRMWTVSYEEGLQKVYYKDNIIVSIYALADWFSPSDVESPTLETVRFFDRKTYKGLDIKTIPPLIFSEVMRDVDLVVSVAHVGGVDPEASLTTIAMRQAIVRETLRLMKIDNVVLEGNHARISGKLGEYSVHLGSAVAYKQAAGALSILPVHGQHRGKLFLPFVDEDPKTAEVVSKIVLLAQDTAIKDPQILSQLRS
ncbi:DUF4132 domain-containing protein [Paenibacillaceae bacterium]|nr:DUF4132 domain-containing protein [Paenibacillaceae bacterium]